MGKEYNSVGLECWPGSDWKCCLLQTKVVDLAISNDDQYSGVR